jgi:hypothetical protein
VVQQSFFEAGATAVSLSLSATEGADLCASTVALVAASADLSLAATEGADLASATAGLAVSANLAGTEGADTASGAVAAVVSAALSSTEGADTAASNVSLLITASMAAVEGADLCAASMDVVAAASVDMALDAAEGADECLASMEIVVPQVVPPPSYTSTAGGGATVPVTDDNLGVWLEDTDESSIVPATPLAQPRAPRRVTIAAGPTGLDLAIAPPYREPVAEPVVLKTLQAQLDGIESARVLKAKHNNHALRLLLLAS